jgi:hypothetical protein
VVTQGRGRRPEAYLAELRMLARFMGQLPDSDFKQAVYLFAREGWLGDGDD